MSFQALFEPLHLARGPALKNRLLLAPLTNWQSNSDGTVAADDLQWLTRCAQGGFSMVMTCAANVHPGGKAFPGQMGIYDDKHLEGLRQIAELLRTNGAVSSVQLHHGGVRVIPEFGGTPVGPSDDPALGARGLSLQEVESLRDDFVAAAMRAELAGFDGVEVHAAFGWIITQFLSPRFNFRTDRYGGSLENRSRFLFEIIDKIRSQCKPDFQIGLRISMERYGVPLSDLREVAARAMAEEKIDYLDLALWDYKKQAQEPPFESQTLLGVFTDLPRSSVRIGASGRIMSAVDAVRALEAGCDFVMLGKGAILKTDLPRQIETNPGYQPPNLPVSTAYLKEQGLSNIFIQYLRTWGDLVSS